MKTISFFKPTITKKDIVEVLDYMVQEPQDGNEFINRFEKKIAAYLKTPQAIFLNHVSSALYLIGQYLQFNNQDEIIVSCLAENFIGEILKLLKVKVVFVDNQADKLQMSIDSIRQKINHKTKAIIITHQLGYPFPVADLIPELKDKRIWVIEDISQAFGTTLSESSHKSDTPLGCQGDFGICSFSHNRLISLGNGGLIFGKNKNALRSLKKQAFIDHETNTEDGQLDFSATELQSAMGIAEISLVDKFISKRKEIAQYYTKCLLQSNHSPLFDTLDEDEPDKEGKENQQEKAIFFNYQLNYYAYPVRFNTDLSLVKKMFQKYHIEVRSLAFNTVFQHFAEQNIVQYFPYATTLTKHILCIPIYPTLLKKDIELIGKLLKNIG